MLKFQPKPLAAGKGTFPEIEISTVKMDGSTVYFNNNYKIYVEIPDYVKNVNDVIQREFEILWREIVMRPDVYLDIFDKRLKQRLLDLLE